MTTVGHLVREAMLKLMAKAFPRGTAPYLEGFDDIVKEAEKKWEGEQPPLHRVLGKVEQLLKEETQRAGIVGSRVNQALGLLREVQLTEPDASDCCHEASCGFCAARAKSYDRTLTTLENQLKEAKDRNQVLAEECGRLMASRTMERQDREAQVTRLENELGLADQRRVEAEHHLNEIRTRLTAASEAFAASVASKSWVSLVSAVEAAVKELHRLWGAERDAREAGFKDLEQVIQVARDLTVMTPQGRAFRPAISQAELDRLVNRVTAEREALREQVSRIGDLEQTGECPHHEIKGGRGCARCFNRVHVRTLADLEGVRASSHATQVTLDAVRGHLKVAEDAAKRHQTFGEACLEALKVVAAQPRPVPTPGQEALLPTVLRSAVIWTVEQLEKKNCLDVLVGQEALRTRIVDDLCLAVVKEVAP